MLNYFSNLYLVFYSKTHLLKVNKRNVYNLLSTNHLMNNF